MFNYSVCKFLWCYSKRFILWQWCMHNMIIYFCTTEPNNCSLVYLVDNRWKQYLQYSYVFLIINHSQADNYAPSDRSWSMLAWWAWFSWPNAWRRKSLTSPQGMMPSIKPRFSLNVFSSISLVSWTHLVRTKLLRLSEQIHGRFPERLAPRTSPSSATPLCCRRAFVGRWLLGC